MLIAQFAEAAVQWGFFGAALGCGITALAAGLGISRIAATAAESVARQPEAANDIRGITIITAAFIEGVCLFAVVVCLLINGSLAKGVEAPATEAHKTESGK
jgi:F-type H+-transporting ATPase subunit c